jgi:hypothetical protein
MTGAGALANLAWASTMIDRETIAGPTLSPTGVAGALPFVGERRVLMTHFDPHANQLALVVQEPR